MPPPPPRLLPRLHLLLLLALPTTPFLPLNVGKHAKHARGHPAASRRKPRPAHGAKTVGPRTKAVPADAHLPATNKYTARTALSMEDFLFKVRRRGGEAERHSVCVCVCCVMRLMRGVRNGARAGPRLCCG